jgi:hypothetical protein
VAREHARIWLDINSDDDFEQLPFDAQAFYCRVIITLADLSYCGVADWRPARLTAKAPDLPLERIINAAAHLEIGRYCLFDLDTEEVLARSFIRRDELLRNPKFAAAVVKAYAGIASKTLRAAVVTEIRRVHDEHPDYSSWANKDVGPQLAKIMAKPGLDELPYTNQITGRMDPMSDGIAYRITNGIGDDEAVLITNGESVPISNPVSNGDSVPIPSTYTSTSTPAPLGGYSGREPHQGATSDSSPPGGSCRLHPNGTHKACRGCQANREADEAEQQQQATAKTNQVKRFWVDVRAADCCDEKGRVESGNRLARCPNHDWSVVDAHV